MFTITVDLDYGGSVFESDGLELVVVEVVQLLWEGVSVVLWTTMCPALHQVQGLIYVLPEHVVTPHLILG